MYKVGDTVISCMQLISDDRRVITSENTELVIYDIKNGIYKLIDDEKNIYIVSPHAFIKEIVGLFYFK